MATARILVVDDDQALCELLEIVLGEDGYVCETATDVGEALERVGRAPFDVVLLDLGLNGEGEKFLQQYAHRNGRHPQVIMMTARPVEESFSQRAGVGAVLRKPFEIQDLSRVVREQLGVD